MVSAEKRVDPLVGSTIGRYRLCARLAAGGMATVYLARMAGPRDFQKWVALKVIHPHLAHDAKFVEMFLDEARLASQIQHPNVCAVTDFGDDGSPYIVMEYMHGEGLGAIVKRCDKLGRPSPTWLFARTLADAAMGLHAAHEFCDPSGAPLHLVHRDVSPQNLFVLYDGPTKVMDFGVARARGRITETATGELKGKVAYMAPEQLDRRELDRRSDIWALGVILYESTTLHRLFRAESDAETMRNVLELPIRPPSELVSGYPAELESLLFDTLSRDPNRRPATAALFAERIERYLYSLPEPSTAGRVGAWMREHFGERKLERDAFLRQRNADHRTDMLHEASDPSVGSLVARSAPSAPRRRPAWWVVSAAFAIAALAGAGVWVERDALRALFTSDERARDPRPERNEGAPEPVATAPSDPVDPPAPPVPTDPPEPGLGRVSATGAEAAPPALPLGDDELGPSAASGAESLPEEIPGVSDVSLRGSGKTPRARAPARPGTVSLLAIPPAFVHWRGQRLGRTPLMEHELPAGAHTLELRPVAGGEPRRITIRIRSGENTSRSVSF